MAMRVAFLAAECEPWAKTGGLADVVDALARALGRTADPGGRTPGGRVPAALPDPSRSRRARRDDDAACPGPAGAGRATAR